MVEAPKSTTTVSTIAIKAGDRCRLVLAVLKAGDSWVKLKIDQCEPAMLDVGGSIEETEELGRLHAELMQKLRAKQENIEDLLAQADRLVLEQQEPDVPVYEAMAASLGGAWKELNRALHARGLLLDQAAQFHACVKRHDQLARRMDQEFRIGAEYASNPEMLQRWLADMSDMRKDLINTTAAGMDYGQATIARLRDLSSMADNDERPRETLNACERVEHTMLRLVDQWTALDASWSESAEKWQRGALAAQWRQVLDRIDQWLRSNEQFLTGNDLGDGAYAAERLLRNCDTLLTEINEQADTLQRAARGIDQMPEVAGSTEKADLQRRCSQLMQRLDKVARGMADRKPLLEQAIAFYKSADVALTALHALHGEARAVDGGRAGGLAGRARQHADPVLKHGEQLVRAAGGRAVPGVRPVVDKMNEVEQLANSIDEILTTKEKQITEGFDREYRQILEWLETIFESFLRQNYSWGRSVTEVTKFIQRCTNMGAECSQEEPRLNALLSKGKSMGGDAHRRTTDLQQRWQRARSGLDRRVTAATTYLSYLKLLEEATVELDWVEAALKRRDAKSQRDVESRWSSLEQYISRLKQTSEQIVQEVGKAGDDGDTAASGHARHTSTAAAERAQRLRDQVRQWKQSLGQIDQLNKTIEEVEFWIRECTELVTHAERRASQLQSSEEASRLAQALDPFDRQKDAQAGKLDAVHRQATAMHFEDTEHRVEQVRRSHQLIVDRLVELRTHLTSLVHTLREKEIRERQRPPKFVRQLQDATVDEGHRVTLSCHVEADPPAGVQWFKDGLGVLQDYRTSYHEGVAQLVIDECYPQDGAVFTCRAQNEAGTAETRARLSVRSKPKGHRPTISPSLVNQVVGEGHRIAFETRVAGEPAPEVRWFINDRPVTSGGEIQIIRESSGWSRLVVTRAGPEHHGIYRVEASNQMGTDQSAATLTVQPARPVVIEERVESRTGVSPSATAPEFVRPFSSEYRLTAGDSVRIECVLIGNPRPKITWSLNGRTILPGSALCSFSAAGDTYAIVIPRVGAEHQGRWRLRAENIRGEADCETTVVVTGAETLHVRTGPPQRASPVPAGQPPHFGVTLVSVVGQIGAELTLKGQVQGSPRPEITWQKDGRPFDPAGAGARCTYAPDGTVTLTFSNAQQAQSGKYTCSAQNPAGVATSSAQLVVRAKTSAPDFAQRLISRESAEGEPVRWSVKVVGDPPPTVKWLRNGEPVPHCAEVQLLEEGQGVFTLYIPKVERADAGQFTAHAENAAGEARSTADLVVRQAGAPPSQYYHVTQVTQARQVAGREVSRNEAYSVESPAPHAPAQVMTAGPPQPPPVPPKKR